jgi:hypothetical protein
MCTLFTIDRDTFLTDRHLYVARILRDAAGNSDGFNLIAIDAENMSLDLNFSCMNIAMVLRMIESFFDSSSDIGRIFLHSRMATTDYIGIPFTHGFTDFKGTLIQHNGVIHNYRNLHVDSHNLTDLDLQNTAQVYNSLELLNEFFANIFLIRPDAGSYGVIRRMAGSLHTDDMGNYSTNAVAGIQNPVPINTHYDFRFLQPLPETKAIVPTQFSDPWKTGSEFETAWDSIVKKTQYRR